MKKLVIVIERIRYCIKIIIKLLYNNRFTNNIQFENNCFEVFISQTVPTLIFSFILLYMYINNSSIEINKGKKSTKNNLMFSNNIKLENRLLEEFNYSDNYKDYELSKKLNLEYLELYNFFVNLTSSSYGGTWKSKSINNFSNKNGVAYFDLKLNSNIYLDYLIDENYLTAIIYLIDGYYKDVGVEYIFNMTLPDFKNIRNSTEYKKLSYNKTNNLNSNNVYANQNNNTSISNNYLYKNKFQNTFYSESFISSKQIVILEETMWTLLEKVGEKKKCYTYMELTFYNKPLILSKKLSLNRHINYSEASMRFYSINNFDELDTDNISFLQMLKNNNNISECNIDMIFNLSVKQEDNNSYRVWNYSFITTVLCLAQCYVTIILFNKVYENNYTGMSLSLISLSINIFWNSIISIFHFFLSAYKTKFSYEYGLPFISYFILFSILELRVLFFAWKSRYRHLQETNLPLFRRELMKFYFLFYFFFFISLLFIKYFYTIELLCYLIFFSTWCFQIYYSAKKGTKPPQDTKYVLIISLAKLFYPVS